MTEPIRLISVEEVKNHGKRLVADSMDELRRDGHLWRRAYLYAPPSANEVLAGTKGAHEAGGSGDKEQGTVIAVLDLAPPPGGLLDMLALADPQFGRVYPLMKQGAERLGITQEQFQEKSLKILGERGIDPGDIIARFLAHMVKKVHAYAVVHVADARMLLAPPAEVQKLTGSLKDNPRAREVLLVSVETRRFQSVTVVEYERDADGKVTRFKKPRTNESTAATESERWSGRLFGLLEDLPLN